MEIERPLTVPGPPSSSSKSFEIISQTIDDLGLTKMLMQLMMVK